MTKFSNFPNGFPNGVTIRNAPVLNTYPGSVFWVDSGGGSDGDKGTFDRPFATIDYAIGKCTASNGDIIMVKPGHAETVSAAGGIAVDVIGVSIIGTGNGTLRPTITLDTAATASVTISAANCAISGLDFVANFADVTRIIDITAANASLDDCEFRGGGTNLNYVDAIDVSSTTDNAADGLAVRNCRAYGVDAANDSMLEINGDLDKLVFEDNFAVHTQSAATAMIECATGKDLTNARIMRNAYMVPAKTSGDILIDNDTTANSGVAAYNVAGHVDTTGEVLIDADGIYMFENYASGVVTASGYLLPAADS